MKTDDIALFCHLTNYTSQQAAADSLGMTASRLSRHISRLEQDLGAELIKRNTRPLTLTPAGQELLSRGSALLSELDELQQSIGKVQQEPEGKVTIAAPLDSVEQVLADSLPNFQKRYPKVMLHFISYQSQEYPSDSLADLTVFISRDNPPDSSMIGKKLAHADRHFFASPEFIAEHPELVHPSQLGSYPCVLTKKGLMPANRWLWQHNGVSQVVNVPGIMESESARLCVAGAAAGLGVAWVPPQLCAEQLEAGQLKLLFDARYATRTNIWGLYSRSRYLPQRIRLVLEHLVSELQRGIKANDRFCTPAYFRGLPTL